MEDKMIKKYNGISPDIDKSAFVAENATIVGKVSIAEKASIWYGAVLRADGDSISVGARSNIQDNAVVHVDSGSPVVIGENVTIGHAAIIHSCKIESNCLIGMGAIILNGAVIGEGSIVGAGALVTKNSVIPPNSMVVGFPAKVKRELTDEEQASIYEAAQEYIELAENTER